MSNGEKVNVMRMMFDYINLGLTVILTNLLLGA
jgi:hypothetical protein